MSKGRSESRRHGWWLWSLNPLALMLWPVSIIFCALVWLRSRLYQRQLLSSSGIGKPVIIVGNISVGGNGKTPVVHSLVKLLQSSGYQPGILTRGYKSDHEAQTLLLDAGETSARAGDEANMLSELCACPVAVGADRVKTGMALLRRFPDLDVVIGDDGLQHYTLRRDMEIIVTRQKALGNGLCLPAGPLREPLTRLSRCDLLIDRDGEHISERYELCWNLLEPQKTRELSSFRDQKINALAAIGFPELFFDALRAQGLELETQSFTDHYAFSASDLPADTERPLLVTHKDAVKLKPFATPNIWVVALELVLSNDLQYRFIKLLESKIHG